MAKPYSTKPWPLLEKIPAGPIKDHLIEIRDQLDAISEANDMLLTLGKWKRDCEEDTITLGVDTLFDIVYQIAPCPDAVFYHLNEVFDPEKQGAVTEGGAACPSDIRELDPITANNIKEDMEVLLEASGGPGHRGG